METVTLHAEDFKKVHNTLCDLRSLVERMTHTMIKIDDVQRIVEGFEQGLADAYAQDNDAFSRKMDYYDTVRQTQGYRAIWSIYEVADLGEQHPFKGALQVAYKDHWGDEPVFEEITGDRWVDLYAAADAAIRRSGDGHHIFIEQFQPNKECPQQLFLQTGS